MIDLTKHPSQLLSSKLSSIKYSQLIIQDLDNQNDVSKLALKRQYLLQSYVLNLVAVWQVFIEDLVDYGVNVIIEKQNDPNTIEILKSNLTEKRKRFNTPSVKNINDLFKSVLGIERICDVLEIDGMTLEQVKSKVTQILTIRHQIAHTAKTSESLSVENNFDYMSHLFNIAKQLEKRLLEELTP